MSFNATLLPPKNAHPTAAELYGAAGTDFDSLNTFERWWVQWYLYFGDPVIATGVLSFLLHEVWLSFPSVYLRPSPIPLDCILWALYTVDHYRRYALLPQMETTA